MRIMETTVHQHNSAAIASAGRQNKDLLRETGYSSAALEAASPNDLVIAKNGTIYFTESTSEFHFEHFLGACLEARGTGSLFRLDPERAHHLAFALLRLVPPRLLRGRRRDDAILRTEALGQSFSNPVGLAAGFDKDARGYEQLLALSPAAEIAA